jgi:peptidoglycan hydrolase-like protein with peptidoglycan-binding domain
MRPIRPGDRGPAVEDIQRRLLVLGYDLGRTGVDSVFLGRTAEAVRSFQQQHGLSEDGTVGDQTWSALVDATFQLGDRALYLRLPHLHGADVAVLQGALNALGFACGSVDGIFGAFTERGVRDFQRNAGLPVDGIVGLETVATVTNLRHVWDGKDAASHSAAHISAARTGRVLARVPFAVTGSDDVGRRIAARVANLALATTADALTVFVEVGSAAPARARFVLSLSSRKVPVSGAQSVSVGFAPMESLNSRLKSALASVPDGGEIAVDLSDEPFEDERDEQRGAVALLDALCDAIE